MQESDFLNLLRQMPLHDGANGLSDDAAVIQIGDQNIIFTKDMMVQGVHYFDDSDPEDVAWKLLAVNLSDLAAKGATPVGVMLGYILGDNEWDRAFAAGFQNALRHYDVLLMGGDTVSVPFDGPHILSLTAIGICDHNVPVRGGAKDGDIIYVSGVLGDAYGGYKMIAAGDADKKDPMVMAYNRPKPLLSLGQKIAPLVHAMMDISDGLLIDAQRMAKASNLQMHINLEQIPLSSPFCNAYGDGLESILQASTWGDDYQLLCAVSADVPMPNFMVPIGGLSAGQGVCISYHGEITPLPQSLGYQHDG